MALNLLDQLCHNGQAVSELTEKSRDASQLWKSCISQHCGCLIPACWQPKKHCINFFYKHTKHFYLALLKTRSSGFVNKAAKPPVNPWIWNFSLVKYLVQLQSLGIYLFVLPGGKRNTNSSVFLNSRLRAAPLPAGSCMDAKFQGSSEQLGGQK